MSVDTHGIVTAILTRHPRYKRQAINTVFAMNKSMGEGIPTAQAGTLVRVK